MPDLTIRIKKRSDGSAALSCLRPDGSSTWQRQEGAQGRFFPIYDLTHYSVGTVLEHRRSFYARCIQLPLGESIELPFERSSVL
jgi:hypothetical protein